MPLSDYDGRRPEPPHESATDRATALQDAIQACESVMIVDPLNDVEKAHNLAVFDCVAAIKGLTP